MNTVIDSSSAECPIKYIENGIGRLIFLFMEERSYCSMNDYTQFIYFNFFYSGKSVNDNALLMDMQQT